MGGAGALWAWVHGFGAIAQLGERYNGIVEVKGSSPFSSTRLEGGGTFIGHQIVYDLGRFDRFRIVLID